MNPQAPTTTAGTIVDPWQDILKSIEAAQLPVTDVFAQNQMLSILMLKPDWIEQTATKIPPTWFHNWRSRDVYLAMQAVMELHRHKGWSVSFDPTSLANAFRDVHGRELHLKAIEASGDINHIKQNVVNIEAEARNAFLQIKAAGERIDAINAVAGSIRDLLDDKKPVVDGLNKAQNVLMQLSQGVQPNGGMRNLGEVDLQFNDLSRAIRPSFLPMFNAITSGLAPKTLSVIGARSGGGKSTFMGAIALDAAITQNIPVLYLDTEMSAEEVLRRHCSTLTGLDERRMVADLQAGNPDVISRVTEARSKLGKSKFLHVPIGGLSPEQAIGFIARFKQTFAASGSGLICYDYIKLPADTGRTPEYVALGKLADQLKTAAGQFDLPILAGVQLGRQAIGVGQAESAEAGSGFVTGSDRILHFADRLCTLRNLTEDEKSHVLARFDLRDDPEPLNQLRFSQVLHIFKQRSGPTYEAGIPLHLYRGQAKYTEMACVLDQDGNPIRENGRLVDSEELKLLHSKDFRRKPKSDKASFVMSEPQMKIAS